MSKIKIVIVGATSAIAEHCARFWVQDRPVNLVLIGRNPSRMERVSNDLQIRSPGSSIRVMQADFHDPEAIKATVASIMADGPIATVLIAHGSLPDQGICQSDLVACREALDINGVSPVLFAEAFADHMGRVDSGVLALIGSVAGDRGRRSNYVYGAAKGLVTRYAQGLQHRFAGTGVSVILIKPGPTDTPMTAHLKSKGAKMAPVDEVAKHIVATIEHRQAVAYVPGRWRLIMFVIKHLPSMIFNRMNI